MNVLSILVVEDDEGLQGLLQRLLSQESHKVTVVGSGEKVDLRGLDLRGLDVDGLDLSDCYFRQADLRSIDFRKARLEGASINVSKISGAYFPVELTANLHGTRMRYRAQG